MNKIKEPSKYNMYMSTKNKNIDESMIWNILDMFIRKDNMSTDMQANMINTGGDIIVGTYFKDICESKCDEINRHCIINSIEIYCWTVVVS